MGPHDVSVVRADLRRDALDGDCDCARRVIRIHDGLSGAELRETLLHECLHLVAEACDVDLPESAVKPMALLLAQMLGDRLSVEGLT